MKKEGGVETEEGRRRRWENGKRIESERKREREKKKTETLGERGEKGKERRRQGCTRGCGNVDKESTKNKMSWRVNDLFEYVCYVPLIVINPIRLIKKLTQPAEISSRRILPSPPL